MATIPDTTGATIPIPSTYQTTRPDITRRHEMVIWRRHDAASCRVNNTHSVTAVLHFTVSGGCGKEVRQLTSRVRWGGEVNGRLSTWPGTLQYTSIDGSTRRSPIPDSNIVLTLSLTVCSYLEPLRIYKALKVDYSRKIAKNTTTHLLSLVRRRRCLTLCLMIYEILQSAHRPSDSRSRHYFFLPISTFSALGVSHVMRSINVRYLLTYLALQECPWGELPWTSHFGQLLLSWSQVLIEM